VGGEGCRHYRASGMECARSVRDARGRGAAVAGERAAGRGREGAHSWEDEDREALVNEDGRERPTREPRGRGTKRSSVRIGEGRRTRRGRRERERDGAIAAERKADRRGQRQREPCRWRLTEVTATK
jgi:hypothetical protein